jgi:hypothetical protein
MNTSYFRNKAAAADPRAISIARWPPRWWGSRARYIALAPSIDLLKRSKAGFPWAAYVEEYKRDVLGKLDPARVYAELTSLYSDPILMCWEVPGEDCHRLLVADWLENALKVKIPEL